MYLENFTKINIVYNTHYIYISLLIILHKYKISNSYYLIFTFKSLADLS